MEWESYAACRGEDPETFFPPSIGGQQAAKEAIQNFCVTCPVRVECLRYAYRTNQHGIWGGTTQRQRAVLRRTKTRQLAPIG